ncbi:MAG: hypothetical protein DHS20C20_21850 [Ardenticatenaceae bacterium]|nr:MAG: hypothetical protein DHS20C20_21850 [Ardenticatenaceae bacterium]
MQVKQGWLYLLLLGGMLLWFGAPSLMNAQETPTATPDAEGIIYAEVLPNDSLWAIAARSGISLAELLDLNNLTEDALIQPGDRLIVGIVMATPTPDVSPTPTATRQPPTPTVTGPPLPVTAICLVAFTDENGNGEREPAEPLQAGIAFTVFTAESVVANYVTDGFAEPFCLTDLVAGNYQVTRSVGRGETLTNSGNRTVILATGDQVMLGFGGFVGEMATATAVAPLTESTNTPTEPAAIIGDAPESATLNAPAADLPAARSSGRPFLIGAGILIGILLVGTAVFIVRRRM